MNQKEILTIIAVCILLVSASTTVTYSYMNDVNNKELAKQRNQFFAELTNLSIQIDNLTAQLENKVWLESIEYEDGTIVTGDLDKIDFIDYDIDIDDQFGGIEDHLMVINASIKNIHDDILDEINVTIRFFTSENYFLGSKHISTKYLIPDKIWQFWIETKLYIYVQGNETMDGYHRVDYISFDISTSE